MSLQPNSGLLCDILSKYQCGSCKGFNADLYVVTMTEKKKVWIMDNERAFGVLMTDLSKLLTVYTIDYQVDAYGFDIKSIKIIQQYL